MEVSPTLKINCELSSKTCLHTYETGRENMADRRDPELATTNAEQDSPPSTRSSTSSKKKNQPTPVTGGGSGPLRGPAAIFICGVTRPLAIDDVIVT